VFTEQRIVLDVDRFVYDEVQWWSEADFRGRVTIV
jgi:hypothetical protein